MSGTGIFDAETAAAGSELAPIDETMSDDTKLPGCIANVISIPIVTETTVVNTK
jgi:hypothetical protein